MADKVDELRAQYVHGNAKKRLSTILDRLEYPLLGPNELCNYVMAIEALSRVLVLEEDKVKERASIERAWNIYIDKYFKKDPVQLLKILCKNAKSTPENAFSEVHWEHFKEAVRWRNFLMHEGSFMWGGDSDRLIKSCIAIFEKLKIIVNVRYQGNITVPKGANANLDNWRIEESHKVLRNEEYSLTIWDSKNKKAPG